MIRWLVSASSGCWPGNILVKLSLGDLLYSRRNKLNKKFKDTWPKINRSRKAAEELARRIRTRHWFVMVVFLPEMGEPGGLTSMGSHRVGHD